jgi:Spy/CpxP family protein refolding chaperone
MNFPRWIRALGPVMAVGLLAVGCEGQAPSESEEEAVDKAEEAIDAPTQAAPDADKAARDHHGKRDKFRGPERIFQAALELDGLSDAQKSTIESLLERPAKSDKDDAVHAARKELMTSLADSVRKNSVDADAFAAQSEKLAPAKDDHHAAFVEKLDTLHATLTPAQRSALVSSIKDKAVRPKVDMDAEHMGRMADHDKDKAGKHDKGGMGPMGMMLKDLEISDAQREQITAAVEKAGLKKDKADRFEQMAGMKEKMDAMFSAFEKSSFDAASVLPAPPEMRGDHMADMAKTLAVVVPLLDESQRGALADKLEQGPMGFKGMHGPDKAGRGKMKRDRRGQSQ